MRYRLIRVEGLHDFRPDNILDFVLYNGSRYETLTYRIFPRKTENCFLREVSCGDNDKIFKYLDIQDSYEYCAKYDTKLHRGRFPEHSSLETLKKTVLSFFNLNTDINIPSKYKVGDTVTIRSNYHAGSTDSDYPESFTQDMVTNFGGKVVKITNVLRNIQFHKKHFIEPFTYEVAASSYTYSAAMFEDQIEDSEEESIERITEIEQLGDREWIIKFLSGLKEYLTLEGSWFLNGHNYIFKLCHANKDNLSEYLNSKLTCIRDLSGYEPYVDRKENIWVFIDHLKYELGTEECRKTINPEFYKFLKTPPTNQGILPQVEYSPIKQQGNAYQFQRRKGTMRAGNVPEGNRIYGKRSKASVSSRPLSYRKTIGY